MPTAKRRFLTNVLWSWLGVGANLLVAILIQRYIIQALGEERYGIWTLVFSILDYFWFFDFGLNSAVAYFCAHYQAKEEPEKINEIINTAVVYFSLAGILIAVLMSTCAPLIESLFPISAAYRAEFDFLIRLTGVAWGLCIVLHMFLSALDGFQRFDLTNRVSVAVVILRSLCYLAVLRAGYGLKAMGLVCVGFQTAGYIANFRNFHLVFPQLRFSRRLVSFKVFREIVSYGVRAFVANGSSLLLNQSGTVMTGHYLPAAFVGFLALPSRILQNAVDAVSRIGIVTRSSSAELHAQGRRESLLQLAIYSNRYSFALFLPLAIFLLPYGRELILLWVGPQYAAHSAPLLPVLLLSSAFVLAGQFNSSSVLYGLRRQGSYARVVTVEAALNVVGMIVVIPRFGILGAVCVASGLMVLFRGLYTPFLLCRALEYPFGEYMRAIYLRPVMTGAPILAMAYLWRRWIPGHTWGELISVGMAICLMYAAAGMFTCLEREHRAMIAARVPWVGDRLAMVLAG